MYITVDIAKFGFQFLIGTLKTFPGFFIAPINEFMFQFLIGTLKTQRNKGNRVEREIVFQFLIGTLKTHTLFHICYIFVFVSIPYRHSKNLKVVSYSVVI